MCFIADSILIAFISLIHASIFMTTTESNGACIWRDDVGGCNTKQNPGIDFHNNYFFIHYILNVNHFSKRHRGNTILKMYIKYTIIYM